MLGGLGDSHFLVMTYMNRSENILFFDLDITGHHVEYLYHLINYRKANPEIPSFILLTHPDFPNRLSELELQGNLQREGITTIHPSPEVMRELSLNKTTYKRAKSEFRILYKHVYKYKVQRCYLMSLNKFQLAVGSRMGRSLPCKIRGILFNPFGISGNKEPAWFTKIRKHFQIRWMLRNLKLEHIFILNDEKLTTSLNRKYGHKNVFVSLPDPILIPPKGCHHNVDTRFPERSNKCRFLLFGSLSARKGIFLVVEALKRLSINISSHIEVVFAGKVVAKDREDFLAALSDIERDKPGITIRHHDYFQPYQTIPELFSNCDCVLVPYIGNQASSGICGHAALYGKPVIGPDRGLIGNLILTYDLGYAINGLDATKLASAIANFFNDRKSCTETKGMQRFVRERDPTRFVETLIEE